MKEIFLAALSMYASVTFGQIKQGTIVYERKADMHRRMQDEQMKAMVPPFQITKKELIFNTNASVYKTAPEDNAPDPFDNGSGNTLQIKLGGPGNDAVQYKNFANNALYEQVTLADKDYIIDDTIRTVAWKLSNETRVVLDHVCKKATVKTEQGNDVTAWYAEDVPVAVGPEAFGGLPGAILLLDINNGEVVYTATELSNQADMKQLKVPMKGKHITRADFNKKLDELFGRPLPDGRRVVRFGN